MSLRLSSRCRRRSGASDLLQFQLEHIAIDLSIGRCQGGCVLGARRALIALREVRITTDLVRAGRECTELLDIQRRDRLVVLALLNQNARGAQLGDVGKLGILRLLADYLQECEGFVVLRGIDR